MARTCIPWLTLPCLLLAAACGSDGTGPGPGSGPITAVIDGVSFVAEFATVSRSGNQVSVNGASSGPPRAIGFTFADAGTGTYTIGPGLLVAAGVTIGNEAWTAGGDLGSGTISVTTFTESRIAGTFTLSLVATGNQSPQTVTVTNGQFDITY